MRYLPAVVLSGLLAAQHAVACSCGEVTICELAESAPVIFVGELLAGGFQSANDDPWSGLASTARFRVLERFRGLPRNANEVEVQLFFVKGMCAPAPYVNGRTYLVYAERDLNGELKDGMCTSSRDVEMAADDLQYLRRYFTGKTKGTIRGRIAASRDSSSLDFALDHGYAKPLDGARIVVRRGVQRWELKCDADGSYEITGLPAGEYSVSARHDQYETGWAGDSVGISSRGCSIQNIGLRAKNLVEGSVFDSEGLPVERIEVSLLSADPNMSNASFSEWTDYAGRFIFRWITPGAYLLSVNPHGISPRSPYPPSFYENTAEPGEAEKLTIGARTELSGLNLVLGRKHPTRKILVQMNWQDGSPVTDATIRCAPLEADDSVRGELGSTDKHGEASCQVFAEQAYRVRLTRLGRNGDPEPREATVSPGQDLARIRFVPSQLDFERHDAPPGRGR